MLFSPIKISIAQLIINWQIFQTEKLINWINIATLGRVVTRDLSFGGSILSIKGSSSGQKFKEVGTSNWPHFWTNEGTKLRGFCCPWDEDQMWRVWSILVAIWKDIQSWLEKEADTEVETLVGKLEAFRLYFQKSRYTIMIDWARRARWWSQPEMPVSLRRRRCPALGLHVLVITR